MIVLSFADVGLTSLSIRRFFQSLPVNNPLSETFVPASCLIKLSLYFICEDRCPMFISLDLLYDFRREMLKLYRIFRYMITLFYMNEREPARILLNIVTYISACKSCLAYVELEAYQIRICLGEQKIINPCLSFFSLNP